VAYIDGILAAEFARDRWGVDMENLSGFNASGPQAEQDRVGDSVYCVLVKG